MRTYEECLPCFRRQAHSQLAMMQVDEATTAAVMAAVEQQLEQLDYHLSPPAMAREIHRLIRRLCNVADPYAAQKRRYQQLALALLPQLRQQVASAANPLLAAVKLAIAGNSIDMGVYHELTEQQALDAIGQALEQPLHGDIDAFATAIQQAQSILYLGDNAGEVVLDTLLLRLLPPGRVTFAVRGAAIINDALRADAVEAGIDKLATLIDNGNDAPGTILEQCSAEFCRCFAAADLIIAKGQGNYETLSDHDANIYFLLKAKCPVVAGNIGCAIGTSLLLHRHKFCDLNHKPDPIAKEQATP